MSSSLCGYGDVVVDGRKLTEVQANRLFVVVGRTFVKGQSVTRLEYEVITERVEAEESPSIDILYINEVRSHCITTSIVMTIYRTPYIHSTTVPLHYTDNNHCITGVFLPAHEYDALIEHINAV